MVKIMKSQKVVIILAGRYAGRKAVVVKVKEYFLFLISLKKKPVRSFSHMMKVAMNVVMVMHLLLVLLVTHVE